MMKKAFFKYIFALLLFGSNGIVASNIHLSSYEIVFWRTLIGSLLLIGIFFVTRQKITFAKEKNDTLFIVFSGITMGTSWMFLYEAYNQIGVSLASLSYYCGPVIVMGLSPILFKEKLTAYKIAGFIAVLIGIFLVNGTVSGENLNAFGIFCGIMSAIMYSFIVILNKKSKKVQGLENATIQLLMSFLTVAISGYLEPLSAIILATLILGETMRPLQIIGAVLIIGGAVFGEYYNSHL